MDRVTSDGFVLDRSEPPSRGLGGVQMLINATNCVNEFLECSEKSDGVYTDQTRKCNAVRGENIGFYDSILDWEAGNASGESSSSLKLKALQAKKKAPILASTKFNMIDVVDPTNLLLYDENTICDTSLNNITLMDFFKVLYKGLRSNDVDLTAESEFFTELVTIFQDCNDATDCNAIINEKPFNTEVRDPSNERQTLIDNIFKNMTDFYTKKVLPGYQGNSGLINEFESTIFILKPIISFLYLMRDCSNNNECKDVMKLYFKTLSNIPLNEVGVGCLKSIIDAECEHNSKVEILSKMLDLLLIIPDIFGQLTEEEINSIYTSVLTSIKEPDYDPFRMDDRYEADISWLSEGLEGFRIEGPIILKILDIIIAGLERTQLNIETNDCLNQEAILNNIQESCGVVGGPCRTDGNGEVIPSGGQCGSLLSMDAQQGLSGIPTIELYEDYNQGVNDFASSEDYALEQLRIYRRSIETVGEGEFVTIGTTEQQNAIHGSVERLNDFYEASQECERRMVDESPSYQDIHDCINDKLNHKLNQETVPFYSRWWFIVICIVVIFLIIVGGSLTLYKK